MAEDNAKAQEQEHRCRTLRPEITEDALDELERLWGAADEGDAEEMRDLGDRLIENAFVLLNDSRDRKRLLERLRRTCAKSSRRRAQLRQVNKSMVLLQQQATQWYRQWAMEKKDHDKAKATIAKMDTTITEQRQELDEIARELQRLRGESRENQQARAFQS